MWGRTLQWIRSRSRRGNPVAPVNAHARPAPENVAQPPMPRPPRPHPPAQILPPPFDNIGILPPGTGGIRAVYPEPVVVNHYRSSGYQTLNGRVPAYFPVPTWESSAPPTAQRPPRPRPMPPRPNQEQWSIVNMPGRERLPRFEEEAARARDRVLAARPPQQQEMVHEQHSRGGRRFRRRNSRRESQAPDSDSDDGISPLQKSRPKPKSKSNGSQQAEPEPSSSGSSSRPSKAEREMNAGRRVVTPVRPAKNCSLEHLNYDRSGYLPFETPDFLQSTVIPPLNNNHIFESHMYVIPPRVVRKPSPPAPSAPHRPRNVPVAEPETQPEPQPIPVVMKHSKDYSSIFAFYAQHRQRILDGEIRDTPGGLVVTSRTVVTRQLAIEIKSRREEKERQRQGNQDPQPSTSSAASQQHSQSSYIPLNFASQSVLRLLDSRPRHLAALGHTELDCISNASTCGSSTPDIPNSGDDVNANIIPSTSPPRSAADSDDEDLQEPVHPVLSDHSTM